VQTVQEHIAARFWSPFELPFPLPTPKNRRYWRALATLEHAVERIIADRGGRPCGSDDLLDRLLSARDPETGAGMSPRQVRDEVMTILMAGHETSAVGLAWALHTLARHPEVMERIRAEMLPLGVENAPAPADLERLAYTRAVLQEALRLFPPAPWLSRRAAGPDRIGNHEVPAGAILVLSPYVVHRDPAFWPEPARFDPGRFLTVGAARRPAYCYFPFGGGPRTCIGHHFAMSEMTVVLAMLAVRFDLRPAPDEPPARMQALVTLRPVGGLPVQVTPWR
jgi:cytochrome P450